MIMPSLVVAGAQLQCTFGAAPATLIVEPEGVPVTAGELPAATVMHFAPIDNIPTFGMCNAPTNPAFIAATAAKLGVPTPVPCVPATVTPWIPGSLIVKIDEMPALHDECKCMCMWLGVISVVEAGQVMVETSG
jgi:hypothetical protein